MPGQTVSEKEQELRRKADRYMPGGSPGNEYKDVVIREGRGGRVWDVSGNEYVDYLLGSGPMLLGPRPSRGGGRGPRPDRSRHDFPGQERGHHLACRGDREGHRLCGRGQVQQHRDRGHSLRHASRPGLPRAQQDPEVRGRLPRDERLCADELRAQRAPGVPPGGARFGGNSAIYSGGSAHSALQRHRNHLRHHRAAPRRASGGDRGTHPTADSSRVGVPRGTPRDNGTLWNNR